MWHQMQRLYSAVALGRLPWRIHDGHPYPLCVRLATAAVHTRPHPPREHFHSALDCEALVTAVIALRSFHPSISCSPRGALPSHQTVRVSSAVARE